MEPPLRHSIVLAFLFCAGVLVSGNAAPAQEAAIAPTPASPPALTLGVTGPAVLVFEHSAQACDKIDYMDAPARAVRVAAGGVQLYAPHFVDRRMAGPDLLHLRQDCRVVYRGGENDDPGAFDDRSWLASLYTVDGITIDAVVHNEFQGHRRPALCPTGKYMDCWYNSLVAAVSTDGGKSFHRKPGAQALVAALPLRYDQTVGHHAGYFNPTGMVDKGGDLYMMAFATQAGTQQEGNCLLRTDRVADPHAWRAWDGRGFKVTFINPYAAASDAQPSSAVHTCAPVGRGRLKWPVTSLVRHHEDGEFIALMLNGAAATQGGGVYYATSPDLLEWSLPVKLIAGEGEGHWNCGEAPPISYPSLLDPASKSPYFGLVGETGYVFMTQYSGTGCRLGDDRNFVRVPVSISR
jgi:hypothetical protein